MANGRREISLKLQCVAAFMTSSRSRGNPVSENNTKARDGQQDGSVAADHQAVAPVREVSDTSENSAGSL